MTILVCSGTFIATLNSAIFAPATSSASKNFGVGREVGALGTALFVLGFASGPLIWAPFSELKGRKWPLTISMLLGGVFTIASAVSKDLQTLIITRFFAGVCGASQLSVVPGVLTDVYDSIYRGIAISVYALTVFGGPFLAPFMGGFITSSYLGWRWTLYVPAILSLVNGGISLLFLKETYAPCLLVTKAAAVRKATGNWGIHAKHEEVEVDLAALAEKYFTRPLRLLFTEPILFAVTLYMSFIYGLVYALLSAYPIVFEDIHGMSPGVAGLTFLALLVGVCVGLSVVLSLQIQYRKRLTGNNPPAPEWRLRPTVLGAPAFTIGLFW
jgi:DHA1 family multidrug resistance protein-like MFS transporter